MAQTSLTSVAAKAPWVSNHVAREILVRIHFAYPVALLFIFLIAFILRSVLAAKVQPEQTPSTVLKGPGGKPLPVKTKRSPKQSLGKDAVNLSPARKAAFDWLSVGVILTFFANAVDVVAHAIFKRNEGWWCGQSVVVYVVASFFVYSLILISLIDAKPAPTATHAVTWSVGWLFEIVLLGASLALYNSDHREPKVRGEGQGKLRRHMTGWEIAEIAIDLVRIVLLSVLIALYVSFILVETSKRRKAAAADRDTEETTGLLNGQQTGNGVANGRSAADYGAIPAQKQPEAEPEAEPDGWSRPTTAPAKSWWEYIRGYSVFFPYLWPAGSRRLQFVVVMCFLMVVLQRVLNVLIPNQVGIITDILSGEDRKGRTSPWGPICVYIVFRVLGGGSGLLGAIRSTLWIPISQYSYQALSTAAFEHVHGLSLDFHLAKRTGEVLSALSKGNSINTFLEQVTFQVLPMLVDLGVAIAYFLVAFDAYYALVVSIITFAYLYVTIRMAQWRAQIRRQMVNAGREEDAVKNDSMVSYETVKYFNAEQYEFTRYRGAVQAYQRAEYKVLLSLNIMNVTQNVVFTLGLLITCFIAAYQVTTGQRKVGRFVTLLTYMAQLQGPLNFFGTFYRSIQSAMINSERMLELFREQPTVVDEPHAQPLTSCEGDIRFEDVEFAYDKRKAALTGLNIRCAPGTSTALVGESGGGKSTVFRLLFRFYNARAGSIKVDGHDVTDVTIDSLRRHIGVVPQDTVLFNETLMYNLKYANPGVSDEVVHEACRAASIHDRIMTFPDGYNSIVGERGLRLSGGEKQRVAIARTILKDPRIILLDEATAALDTETEQNIQTALASLAKGRTLLVIAHRLSTITSADQIVVLHAGKVVECGTHEELLAKKGRYASMWRKQIRAQRAAEEARVLKDRAEKLKEEAAGGGIDSASQSEDERQAFSGKRGTGGAPSGDSGDSKPPGHP
ncbi:hypothetical protein L228DRAFT_208986 [Xylona heveae TC161]|uniref:Heavy metal tolerance protein n=1 Tax=Xylona heveae (strain CBS 132557 / TC161) TaxID=1328760 RepID=A0A165I6S7_XYLHT|nr:hypothetical protein L228DRAFT_208986 [Xylona heveae TC161]KZF24470.1 hypothetical protein L228DRAFT_208986 [Xylona heveae TC161]